MSITSRINEMSSHIEDAYDELQGLGADLTNVDKNIENISMVLDDIYDSMPQVSGEGTSLTLDDTRVGKIKSTLKGNTSQTGTPTPSSPIPVNVVSGDNEIEVCGKNLYNSSDTTYYEACTYVSGANTNQYKVKATGTDVIINIQISSGSNYSANAGTLIPCKYGETIYYDIGNSNFGKNIVTQYNSNKVSLGFSALNTGSSSGSYTPTDSDCEYISIRIGYGSATSGTEYKIAPIFSKTSNLTYEPYIGNTYNIDLPVENLLPITASSETINGVTFTINEDGSITANGTSTGAITYYTNGYTYTLLSAGTYTISDGIDEAGGENYDTTYMTFLDGANAYSIGTHKFFTLAEATNVRARIVIRNGVTLNNVTFKIQLEKGSKQNNFTPYGTTPIEMCKIGDYTDYFLHDKTLDKWYLHKEIEKYNIDISTLGIQNNYANIEYATIPKPNNFIGYDAFDEVEIICKSAIYIAQATSEWNNANLVNKISGNATKNKWWLGFPKGTGITTIQNALNGSYIYYPLATPTNTEITYQPLIDQLNLLEKAMSKENQTNISQVNNDLPFIISASALKEWSDENE